MSDESRSSLLHALTTSTGPAPTASPNPNKTNLARGTCCTPLAHHRRECDLWLRRAAYEDTWQAQRRHEPVFTHAPAAPTASTIFRTPPVVAMIIFSDMTPMDLPNFALGGATIHGGDTHILQLPDIPFLPCRDRILSREVLWMYNAPHFSTGMLCFWSGGTGSRTASSTLFDSLPVLIANTSLVIWGQ
ncbi:hypothetical protein HYPSUDRAFT_208406 [Hypholoma sublateritium FD-334 SS-4]|uniref:Uncharacterized protein n=1 Tax=Hypholoma sublateritium (strain FD-334 SS-4) TaxID=945553 RepID=A0A0D2KJH1_HYPSF|nr:hypothetical protein HYPSUDRAFT_208406 [Hypholoma sublateritium FD-334 SS-4]